MKYARIYCPAKTTMQSGRAKSKHWFLEFLPDTPKFIEPVMGWTGSSDMRSNELTLTFDTKEEAIDYAKRENIAFELIEPKNSTIKIRSYTENFLS